MCSASTFLQLENVGKYLNSILHPTKKENRVQISKIFPSNAVRCTKGSLLNLPLRLYYKQTKKFNIFLRLQLYIRTLDLLCCVTDPDLHLLELVDLDPHPGELKLGKKTTFAILGALISSES
jgi:hypothetical protein